MKCWHKRKCGEHEVEPDKKEQKTVEQEVELDNNKCWNIVAAIGIFGDAVALLTDHFEWFVVASIAIFVGIGLMIIKDLFVLLFFKKETKDLLERKDRSIESLRNKNFGYNEEEKKQEIEEKWNNTETWRKKRVIKKERLKKRLKTDCFQFLFAIIFLGSLMGKNEVAERIERGQLFSYNGEDKAGVEENKNEEEHRDKEESGMDVDQPETMKSAEVKESEEDNTQIKMNFVLDDPQKIRDPANNDPEEVFYIQENSQNPLEDVRNHLNQCADGKIDIQVDLECQSQIEEGVLGAYNEAILQETEFKEQEERAKELLQQNNYQRWVTELPHSKTLDYIIDCRKYAWKNGMQSSALAFSLANNYQEYALEYGCQERDPETMLCLYMDSIKWCELALIRNPDDVKMQKYLMTRYKDIMGSGRIPKLYREKADRVYRAMEIYFGL